MLLCVGMLSSVSQAGKLFMSHVVVVMRARELVVVDDDDDVYGDIGLDFLVIGLKLKLGEVEIVKLKTLEMCFQRYNYWEYAY